MRESLPNGGVLLDQVALAGQDLPVRRQWGEANWAAVRYRDRLKHPPTESHPPTARPGRPHLPPAVAGQPRFLPAVTEKPLLSPARPERPRLLPIRPLEIF